MCQDRCKRSMSDDGKTVRAFSFPGLYPGATSKAALKRGISASAVIPGFACKKPRDNCILCINVGCRLTAYPELHFYILPVRIKKGTGRRLTARAFSNNSLLHTGNAFTAAVTHSVPGAFSSARQPLFPSYDEWSSPSHKGVSTPGQWRT